MLKEQSVSTENVGVNVGVKLSKTEKAVLELIKKDTHITAEQISAALNVSQRTIERALKSLKEKTILERTGSDKTGEWNVIK